MSFYGPGFELSPEPPAGQPPPGKWRPRSRRVWIGGAAAFVVLAGGVGGLVAASGSSTPEASAAASAPTSTTTPAHPGRFGPRVGLFPGGNVIHGTYTAKTPSGSYQTYDVQVGQASNVSNSSITVTSADGYAHTYTVTASTIVDAQRDGIASVASGDQVRLVATVSGSTATATNIVDATKVGSGPAKSGGFVRGPGGPSAPAPAA